MPPSRPSLPNDSQELVVHLVGHDVSVLELGSGPGHVTRRLTHNGCDVVAVEIDHDAARLAAPHARAVHVGDLDSTPLDDFVGDERFDRIVAADVFEHLVDPVRALIACRDHLNDDGLMVISIPNVAHADVRLMLAGGRWTYMERGLLDRTHVRFFDRDGVTDLLDSAGFAAVDFHTVVTPPLATELAPSIDRAALPEGMVERLRDDPTSHVYQYVVTAKVTHDPRGAQVAGAVRYGDPHGVTAEPAHSPSPDQAQNPAPGQANSPAQDPSPSPVQSIVAGDDERARARLTEENLRLRDRVRELEDLLENLHWAREMRRARASRLVRSAVAKIDPRRRR